MSEKKILVTGAAGFIGFHLSMSLLEDGYEVLGIDSINDYYDTSLKVARINQLKPYAKFKFDKIDIANRESISQSFKSFKPHKVVNLAAQAGVRYSIQNPQAYLEANLIGFFNIIELCRHNDVKGLIYASSSSVYGANKKMPFSENDKVDKPLALYGATKKANELIAHSYSHLYGLHSTGLRYFTVYGPWGRPDMAMFIFTKKIMAGEPIPVYNNGNMKRDFTYIDDIVEGVIRIIRKPPAANPGWEKANPDPATSWAPYHIYNIGNNQVETLMHFIEVLEDCLGKKALKKFLPMQDGDVAATYANVDDLVRDFDFKPSTSIETGLENFVKWYRGYYR